MNEDFRSDNSRDGCEKQAEALRAEHHIFRRTDPLFFSLHTLFAIPYAFRFWKKRRQSVPLERTTYKEISNMKINPLRTATFLTANVIAVVKCLLPLLLIASL